MFYDNYNYCGISDFICRYCSNKGNTVTNDYEDKLLSPCKCVGMQKYSHLRCLKKYIKTSCKEEAYAFCPLCQSPYTLCFNFELNMNWASRMSKLSFLLELIKCIIIILLVLFVSIITSVLINDYVYDYANFLKNLLHIDTISVIGIVTFIIFSIISNLLAVVRALIIMLNYRVDKNCQYRVLNYYMYTSILNDKFHNNICKIVFVLVVLLLVVPMSFASIMLFAYLCDKKYQTKNRFYASMYCAIYDNA